MKIKDEVKRIKIMGLIRSPSDHNDTRATTCGLDLFLIYVMCGLDSILFDAMQ